MAYVIVFLAALVAGGLTYWLTLRSPGTEPSSVHSDGDGFLPQPPPAAAGSASMGSGEDAYVPIGVDRRSWQTRVAGLLGLVITILLGAAVLAFSLYQAGSLVARLVVDYAK